MKSLLSIFNRIFGHRLTGREINMWDHSGWGDSIYWLNFNTRRIAGHLHNPPEKGDIINCQMQSGKIAQFIVVSCEVMSDPSDQFFATVSDYQYK